MRRLRSHRPLGSALTEPLSEERGKLLYQANQASQLSHLLGWAKPGREQPKSGRPMLVVNGVESDPRKTRFVCGIEDRASSHFFVEKGSFIRRVFKNPACLADLTYTGFRANLAQANRFMPQIPLKRRLNLLKRMKNPI